MIDNFDDIYMAGVKGGITYDTDHEFAENMRHYANLITKMFQDDDNARDLDVSLDSEQINIEKQSSPIVNIVLNNNESLFQLGQANVKSFREGNAIICTYLKILDRIENKIKNDLRKKSVGFQPLFAIPFYESSKTEQVLRKVVNYDFFNEESLFCPSNEYRFKLSFALQWYSRGIQELQIENHGNAIIVSPDIKIHYPDNDLSILSFSYDVFSDEYLAYLFDFIKNVTNDFNGVNMDFLLTGKQS